MKKSVDDFVPSEQDKKNETLPSQKPGNEKPDHDPLSFEGNEKGISSNDYWFRDDRNDVENIPVQPETWEELRHAPSEKPW